MRRRARGFRLLLLCSTSSGRLDVQNPPELGKRSHTVVSRFVERFFLGSGPPGGTSHWHRPCYASITKLKTSNTEALNPLLIYACYPLLFFSQGRFQLPRVYGYFGCVEYPR